MSSGSRLARHGVLLIGLVVFALALYEALDPAPRERVPRLFGWKLADQLVVESQMDDLTLQFFDGSTLYATRYKEVWLSADLGRTWRYRGRLPAPEEGWLAGLRHGTGSTRLVRGLRGARGIESMLVLRSGTYLASLPPWIYRSDNGGASWERVHRFRTDPEPKGILRHWDEDGRGRVWYGEYGQGKGDSRVWLGSDDGREWKVEYTFPQKGQDGGVRHIHGVQVDPLRGRPWITTGDRGSDIRLGWLEVDGTFRAIGQGVPEFKAVSLMFTGSWVYWATDTPRGPCGIWRWSRTNDTAEQVAELTGPAFFSTVLQDGTLLVSTEVEGVGLHDAQLWMSRDGEHWEEIAQIPHFRDPRRRRRGTLSFPLGKPLPELLLNVDRLGRLERAVLRARLR